MNMTTLLNTILSNASAQYQARVPVSTADNLADVREAILSDQLTENEFLKSLINKVALTIVWSRTFKNPLSVLKKGSVPYGRNIEEIYTNPATDLGFDPTGATLLNREIPDTKTIYHTMNRKGKYKVTISKSQLMGAFQSFAGLQELLDSIVNTLYSGDNYDEFMLMKELFGSAVTGEMIKTVSVGTLGSKDNAKSFVKAIKTVGKGMEKPSTLYNNYFELNKDKDSKPVITWTPKEKQILLLRDDVAVDVDVELLAQAFNVSYTDLEQRTLSVDTFGSASNCGAILCDESFVRVYENLKQMESFHNGEGLYDNFMLHHWQTYSLSLFANAMAFTFEPTE